LFEKLKPYIEEQGFDFQDLNGKLLPFLEYNRREMQGRYDLTVVDYYDIEAFMFRLNEKVREKTFRPGASTRVSQAFRNIFPNYQSILEAKRPRIRQTEEDVRRQAEQLITEYHGSRKAVARVGGRDGSP
jgi:hypothetical protein